MNHKVLLLGTLHSTHAENPNYSFERLYQAVEDFKPEVIAVEMRAQDLCESNEFLEKYYPPEMVGAKALYEKDLKVCGFDWRGDGIENLPISEKDETVPKLWDLAEVEPELHALIKQRKALMEPFFKVCSLEACQLPYKEAEEAEIEQLIKNWIKAKKLEQVMAYSQKRETTIQQNVLKIIEENPGKRIVILTGRGHRKELSDFLFKRLGIRI